MLVRTQVNVMPHVEPVITTSNPVEATWTILVADKHTCKPAVVLAEPLIVSFIIHTPTGKFVIVNLLTIVETLDTLSVTAN